MRSFILLLLFLVLFISCQKEIPIPSLSANNDNSENKLNAGHSTSNDVVPPDLLNEFNTLNFKEKWIFVTASLAIETNFINPGYDYVSLYQVQIDFDILANFNPLDTTITEQGINLPALVGGQVFTGSGVPSYQSYPYVAQKSFKTPRELIEVVKYLYNESLDHDFNPIAYTDPNKFYFLIVKNEDYVKNDFYYSIYLGQEIYLQDQTNFLPQPEYKDINIPFTSLSCSPKRKQVLKNVTDKSEKMYIELMPCNLLNQLYPN